MSQLQVIASTKTTVQKLQAHLNTAETELLPEYFFKQRAKGIVCADGTTLSVQASEDHYCTPRNNQGPYTEVEVWCISNMPAPIKEIEEFDYSPDEPSGYVPIEAVAQFIDAHGGFKE